MARFSASAKLPGTGQSPPSREKLQGIAQERASSAAGARRPAAGDSSGGGGDLLVGDLAHQPAQARGEGVGGLSAGADQGETVVFQFGGRRAAPGLGGTAATWASSSSRSSALPSLRAVSPPSSTSDSSTRPAPLATPSRSQVSASKPRGRPGGQRTATARQALASAQDTEPRFCSSRRTSASLTRSGAARRTITGPARSRLERPSIGIASMRWSSGSMMRARRGHQRLGGSGLELRWRSPWRSRPGAISIDPALAADPGSL